MVITSIAAGYILTAVFLLFRNHLFNHQIGRINAEKAVSKGHVVYGVPLKYPDWQTDTPGIVGYSLSGKYYQHETFDMDTDAETIKLFYLVDPLYAQTYSELGKYQWSHRQLFMFITICCCLAWMISMQFLY